MKYRELAARIIALQNADLKVRGKLIRQGKLGEGYNEEMASLHNRNAGLLAGMLDAIGYPTSDKVSEETNEAAWLVI